MTELWQYIGLHRRFIVESKDVCGGSLGVENEIRKSYKMQYLTGIENIDCE